MPGDLAVAPIFHVKPVHTRTTLKHEYITVQYSNMNSLHCESTNLVGLVDSVSALSDSQTCASDNPLTVPSRLAGGILTLGWRLRNMTVITIYCNR